MRNKDGQLWYGSMIHHKSVSGEQTNMIKTRLWKRLKWILMDKDDKKKRWPTLTWMHLKSVCGQQTNKDNAEQVFEVRWGGWQTWSCQFVKRSCKRHFFLTFSHHDDDVVECSWHESVQESLLTFFKNCIVPFSKIKKCCFPFWGKRGTPPLLPLYHQNKLWYRLTISRLVLQLLCPFLLLMVQILVAKMICQHCIARMVIAWWFFWTIYTFSRLLYEWLRIFMFAAKIVFSFDFANFLVCTTYNECHGVQNQTIIGTFFCSFGFCPNSLPPTVGEFRGWGQIIGF